MRLGSYSTIDCPTDKVDEALTYLQTEFAKIGGSVRKVMNPHDFGSYPSFEIDYSTEAEEAKEYVDMNEDSEEDPDQFEKKQQIIDDWHDKANEIEAEYNKKFAAYL